MCYVNISPPQVDLNALIDTYQPFISHLNNIHDKYQTFIYELERGYSEDQIVVNQGYFTDAALHPIGGCVNSIRYEVIYFT